VRLADRVALVTGGASGIGLATAERFLEEGARVVIADISEERGRAATDQLRERGHGQVTAVTCDLSRGDDVAALVGEVIVAQGRIDVLFNNAGLFALNELHEIPEEEWARLLAVNLTSVYLVSKHVIPHMLARGKGAIVNNCSVVGIVGDTRSAAYCATKGAVAQLTKAMALDYARKGIRVNAICCGQIDTPLTVNEAAQRGLPVDEFRAMLSEAHPIGRIGLPREAAEAVLFLASDESSFITGILLPVDGGYSAA
jgi:NAD(P)-dependent dehydrogenase (short-subunit alcohol dehydrogenase family)